MTAVPFCTSCHISKRWLCKKAWVLKPQSQHCLVVPLLLIVTFPLPVAAQIPRVRARLANFLVKFEGQENLGWIGEVLQMHLAAHAELRASPCFAAALSEALVLGNFLNHGSRLGQAAGFRLKNLPKLQVSRLPSMLAF